MRRFLFVLIFFSGLFAAAQQIPVNIKSAGGIYNFNNLSAEEGLLGSTVEWIYQDSRGYVWIGTRSGLNRYNGFTIETFDESDGLVYPRIHAILEDSDGIMWIGTDRGLSSYNGFEFTNYTVEEGLNHSQVWSLLEHPNGGILIGTSDGIDIIKNGKISHFKDCDNSKAETRMMRSMFYDSKGQLWVGTNKGTWLFKDERYEGERIINGGLALSFVETDDGAVWISGWKPLHKIQDTIITTYKIGTAVNSMGIGKDGNIWMATWDKGLLKYDRDTTAYRYGEDEGLSLNTLWNVMVDREGTVWGASYGGGVSQLVDERFSQYSTANGLVNNTVVAVVEDFDDNLWVATSGGISRISPDGEIMNIRDDPRFTNLLVQDMKLDSNGHVWFCFYAGKGQIFEWDGEKLIQHENIGAGFGLLLDSRGGIWWGSDGGGAHRFYEGEFTSYRNRALSPRQRAYQFFEDSHERIWMGMYNRAWNIYDYRSGKFHYDVFPERFVKETGWAGCEDYHGNFWLSLANKGVYRCSFEDGVFEIVDSLTKENGLMDADVWGLLEDDQGLWMNSLSGLTYFDLNTYYQENKKVFTYYDRDKGYKGSGATNMVMLDDNRMAIGTSKGVLIFHKDRDRKLEIAPLTEVSEIRLDKRYTDWSEKKASLKPNTNIPWKLELPYNENHLTFSFIGLSFSQQRNVRYRFMLEGFDSDWSPVTDQREITYSNIPAGEYLFKVQSMNKDGVWDDSPDTVEVIIQGAFWQSWVFRVAVVVALIYFIYLLFRWRTKKLEDDKRLLEARVEKRTEQLQTAFVQIEEKNQEITDSISYAKRIQKAILPPVSFAKDRLGECFILYLPKDIVAGDFYWINRLESKTLFAVGDCTGHGVPGAMVSVVCHGALNRSVREFSLNSPADILDKTREIVLETFEKSEEQVKDGMDIALCSIDLEMSELEYSGAHNSVYIVEPDGELVEIRPDKQPIGKFEFAKPFTNHKVKLKKGSSVYIFSDGYPDQFGGEKGKKFKYKALKQLLVETSNLPVDEQRELLYQRFQEWKGELEQIDDVCVMGLRI